MNIQKTLEGMNKTIRIGIGPDAGQVKEWLRTIEAAMREPKAWEVYISGCGSINSNTRIVRNRRDAEEWRRNGAEIKPLYEFPPDAAAELLSITEQLAASREENSRLRKRRGEIDDEAYEYAEQVERLTQERDQLRFKCRVQGACITEQRDELAKLNTENERLRGDLHVATNAHAGVLRELEDARAEIERLKSDREKGHADYCALMDRYDDQHNEIERLRKALSDA